MTSGSLAGEQSFVLHKCYLLQSLSIPFFCNYSVHYHMDICFPFTVVCDFWGNCHNSPMKKQYWETTKCIFSCPEYKLFTGNKEEGQPCETSQLFWGFQQIFCRLHFENCTVNVFYFEFFLKDSFKIKFSNGNYSSLNKRRYQFLIKYLKSRKRAIFVRLLAIIFTLCMFLQMREHFFFRQVWKGCKVDCFCFFIYSILSYRI